MISQYSLSALLMTVPDNDTLRLAQTALMVSYSMALLGSLGRVAGRGDGVSGWVSSSEADSYSEPSSEPDSLEESTDEGESALGVPRGVEEDREVADPAPATLSFFRRGSRAKFQGPVPFSDRNVLVILQSSNEESAVPCKSNFRTSDLDLLLIALGTVAI